MGLIDKVEDAYVFLVGNRITAAARMTFLLCTGKLLFQEIDFSIADYLSMGGMVLGASLSDLGKYTSEHYHRTLQEVQNKGMAGVDFFKESILRGENEKFFGYCNLQGLYLGAKKTRQLANFYQARRDYSKCVIPNF
ncbi:MAG: hypothetical protein WCV90_01000 [Candidatus Woesearchaeota archaeon]